MGGRVLINAMDVKADLLILEQAFPDTATYAGALAAILNGITSLLSRRSPGGELKHALPGWRKHKCASPGSARLDLRIVFRADADRVELLGFGHRDDPWDLYGYIAPRAPIRKTDRPTDRGRSPEDQP